METAFKNMRTELNQWIQNFAIVAPYEGKASFSKYWSIGQYVTPGEEVMTIIPVENQLVGKLLLPTAKSGKVKIGQKVSIKLDSYPYMEFGLVQGIVQAISLMPYEKNYLVDVSYKQFFAEDYDRFERMGVPLIFPPQPGIYMTMDSLRNQVATIINKYGWIELTDDVLKAYLDGFALSYRNALFYEDKELRYETNYTAKDYKNFLIHEDSQVLHEGTRVLGYQRELIKNPAKLFQIK